MPRNAIVFDIFISCPGDVKDELNKLETIVSEINQEFITHHNALLNLIRWETRLHSGIGQDIQKVVNKQVGDKYDLYVGVIWSRFGTKTPRAGSGTEEEFNRALQRYRDGDRNLEIMFFTRESGFPKDVDANQLKRVRSFKKRLTKEGVLCMEYESVEDFGRIVNRHFRDYLCRKFLKQSKNNRKLSMEMENYSLIDGKGQEIFTTINQTIAEFIQHLVGLTKDNISLKEQISEENIMKKMVSLVDLFKRDVDDWVFRLSKAVDRTVLLLINSTIDMRSEKNQKLRLVKKAGLETQSLVEEWQTVLRDAPNIGKTFINVWERLLFNLQFLHQALIDFDSKMEKIEKICNDNLD